MTTPTTPLAALQRSLYERLNGDPTLMGLVTGVYDYVPETATHPYVDLGEAYETPRNWHGGYGRESVATLHVWTKARGFRQGEQIAARIVALLDHQPLTVAGQNVVSVRYDFGQALRDPNPTIRHHVIRFRTVTEQEE